jgi:hypothetical protein
MRSSFLQKTWRELEKPLRLKQKNNFNRRKNWWKNKKMLQLPKLKQEKPKCLKWTPREHQRLHQPSFKLLKRIRQSLFFQKPKRRWMRTWMTLSIWIKWFCIPKLSLSETNSSKRTKSLSRNGLRNRKS